ncbi:MAG TPA: DUF4390 domain-containing protein [Methylotenera sp.]|nr:DUF4390 domain-containing protein [Methylotenera sp.]
MHYCKKIKQLLLASFLACTLGVFATGVMAGTSNLNILSADIEALDDGYVLNADIDIKFNEEIEQALIKGFELNFITEFQLVTPHQYWFDDEIATVTRRVTLSYHALSRQYLITHGEQQKTFATLVDAIDALSEIRGLKVFLKSDVEKAGIYKATLLMRLDKTKLPKTLQGDAISLDEWKMTSQRFEWSPNLFK